VSLRECLTEVDVVGSASQSPSFSLSDLNVWI